MNTYRVSYQNHEDATIRNRHKRVKANSEQDAFQLVYTSRKFITVYKVELI